MNKQYENDTAIALSYLREQFGEGWHVWVFGGPKLFTADALHGPVGGPTMVGVMGHGPDPMTAARACVEAWRRRTSRCKGRSTP